MQAMSRRPCGAGARNGDGVRGAPREQRRLTHQERLMAKQSQVLRDRKRKQLIEKFAAKRAALRQVLNDANASIDEKLEAQEKFAKLPRNSCPTRLKRRCEVTGRARGYYRKFGISRIALRELGLRGQLPGVRKSSW
jgi:small subunit ribosomal protein S14